MAVIVALAMLAGYFAIYAITAKRPQLAAADFARPVTGAGLAAHLDRRVCDNGRAAIGGPCGAAAKKHRKAAR
jgi:hypothetical protein